MAGTNIFSDISSTLSIALADASGLAILAKCTGAPPTTANVFQHGCLIIRTDSGSGNPALYENTGTSAVPSWNLVGAVSAGEITLANGSLLVGNGSGVAAAVALSGDATIVNTGAITIANGAVTPAKQSTSARMRLVCSTISPLPAPTGSNQSNLDRYLFTMPAAGAIVAARITSSTVTSGSDATNQYQFVLRNSTAGNNFGSATTNTNGSELSADTAKALTTDQNLTVADNDVIVLRTSILDDGSAGPTSLATATVKVEVEFTI